MNPKITVLMPVYNGESHLHEAIDSILNQTFQDFAFLIIDDGSTDHSLETIQSYHDPRIQIIQNSGNLGLITTLNHGIDLSKGQYIARMDCDDISLPERLQKQFEFMELHLEVGICGTFYKNFGTRYGKMFLPIVYPELKTKLFFNSYLGHPTVIMRSSLLKKYNLRYNPAYIHAEDYGLWVECSFLFPIVNIPEILLYYRISPTSICQLHKQQQRETVKRIHKENLKRLGIWNVTDDMLIVHEHLVYMDGNYTDTNLVATTKNWLQQIKEANQKTRVYPEPYFTKMIEEKEKALLRKSGCGMTASSIYKN